MNSPHPIDWQDDARREAFARWLGSVAPAHGIDAASVRAASADASFRRYFRVDAAGPADACSFIVMDMPPSPQDAQRFTVLADLLRQSGVRTPKVLTCDAHQGFMLMEDLGSTTLLDAVSGLDALQAAPRYRAASGTLIALQGIDARDRVPAYDEAFLKRELDLFVQWYADRHCGAPPTDEERSQWSRCERLILDACLSQPAVLVHRDFHSRNLMTAGEPDGAPGVLDFQDAVWGPVTYDLVSLLRDAYVHWEEDVQLDWAIRYWERARKAGVPVDGDFGEFWRGFEWMGLQRHLKVLGIFARLAHRDGKAAYLQDLPRVWRYAHRVAARYQGLGPLALWLERLAGTQRESGYTF